jgi:D-beta-D-heptose 7-phosphate kinase/D-beta-D-heptose 1-phosphate adenosyltransferase
MSAPLPGVGIDRARAIVERFSGATVLVAGDVMLDRFLVGRVDRISPEAPVPIVAFDHEEHRIGGAGNVASNVVMLGGRVELVGLVGSDPAGEQLAGALRAHRIPTGGLVTDAARRTTTKVRVVTTRNQQVARIDYETDAEAEGASEKALVDRATTLAPGAGALVISDYLKGAVTRGFVASLVDAARVQGAPLLVDPKIPHLAYYAGATYIKPNHHEAETATHRRIRNDDEAREAARAFRDAAACRGVLMTRSEYGMWLLDDRFEGHLPATAREVADVTGAGDTVIAVLALALAAGASSAEAASLANHAAGIVVGKFGPATVSRAELLHAVLAEAQEV